MRKLNNAFTRIPVEELKAIIQESSSISQVFRRLNLNITGDQFKTFRRTMARLQIETNHLTQKRGLGFGHPPKTNKDIFQDGISIATSTLKYRIRRDNLMPYECVKCANKGKWRGKELVLQLDHIDGNRLNNRLDNLRFLCPNCHTQTPTHSQGGKRIAAANARTRPKCSCGSFVSRQSHQCCKCASKTHGQKTIEKTGWPLPERVASLIWSKSMTDAAQEIDVSPNGLKRFCIRNGIQMPPVGYWQRRASGYSHEQSLVSQKPVRGPRKLVSGEMLDTVRQLMREGLSLRKAAKSVGCCHTTLLTRLVGDPVLLLSKHGNAKHMKMAARAGIEPANEISS